MSEVEPAPPKADGQDRNVALFLALYLLLLAFFILLNSLATLEEVRVKAVIQSVADTFAVSYDPRRYQQPVASEAGDTMAPEEVQRQVGSMIEAAIPAAKVEVRRIGELMEVVLPADEVFLAGSAAVNPAQRDLFDRIVGAFGALPVAYRAELGFLVAVRPSSDGLPIGETLEVARSGALARAFTARGLAPANVTVGLESHSDPQVRLIVRIIAKSGSDAG